MIFFLAVSYLAKETSGLSVREQFEFSKALLTLSKDNVPSDCEKKELLECVEKGEKNLPAAGTVAQDKLDFHLLDLGDNSLYCAKRYCKDTDAGFGAVRERCDVVVKSLNKLPALTEEQKKRINKVDCDGASTMGVHTALAIAFMMSLLA